MRTQGPNGETAVGPNLGEFRATGQAAKTDQIRGLHQTLLHQVDQPGAAGQDLGLLAVLFKQG